MPRVGRITLADWEWPPWAAIRASIAARSAMPEARRIRIESSSRGGRQADAAIQEIVGGPTFLWIASLTLAMTVDLALISNGAPIAPVRNARRKRGRGPARRGRQTPIQERRPPLSGQTRTEARSRRP